MTKRVDIILGANSPFDSLIGAPNVSKPEWQERHIVRRITLTHKVLVLLAGAIL